MFTKEKTQCAYVAVVREDGSWIGLAERGKRGYIPISGPFQNYNDAQGECTRRNARLGLSEMEALDIIGTTMRRGLGSEVA